MKIYCKIVEMKDEKLHDLGNVNLTEGFLPIIGDSIRFMGSKQFRVVDRAFWIMKGEERINIYVKDAFEKILVPKQTEKGEGKT